MWVIRNYGPARDFPYKGQNINLPVDGAIETEDSELVEFFQGFASSKVSVMSQRGSPMSIKSATVKAMADEQEEDKGNEPKTKVANLAESTEEKEPVGSSKTVADSYDKLGLSDLRSLAKTHNIALPKKATKEQIIKVLQEKLK